MMTAFEKSCFGRALNFTYVPTVKVNFLCKRISSQNLMKSSIIKQPFLMPLQCMMSSVFPTTLHLNLKFH